MRNINSLVHCHRKCKKILKMLFSCSVYVVSGKGLRSMDSLLSLLLTMQYNGSFRYPTMRLLNYWLVNASSFKSIMYFLNKRSFLPCPSIACHKFPCLVPLFHLKLDFKWWISSKVNWWQANEMFMKNVDVNIKWKKTNH